ncbi:quinone oxidoreductase family protein [Candidatus Pelagibacter sp. HIMB1517]|uniref:quinone oxidoreductase family protein n=1 Tax=Candidatus Pelagibacter sp. HIMB1517 TaxID=3413341 RepID=UPI003F86AD8C
MVKVVEITEFGDPSVLKINQKDLQKLQPNEVLVENKSIGLNFIDTYHRTGLYPIPLPSGIGLEAAGVVKEVGPDVKLFKAGDHVSHASMPIGAYSELQIMPEAKLVKVPKSINFEEASAITLKGMTCEYLLHRAYKAKKGEVLLFHAAAGGVGQLFCQWAKALGCTVIGTVGSDEKIQIAKKNGCDHVINYSAQDFAAEVLKITNGKGADVIYDGVGEKTFEKSLEAIKLRGMFISFGNASGPVKTIDLKKHLAPKAIFFTRPSVMPYTATREELELSAGRVFEAMESKKIKIDIFKKYSLDEARKSHEDLESRKLLGPAVLIP